jgi:transposase
MRAIWSLGRGLDRSSVAMFCNVHGHTVLEWIHRFNERGIDGLLDSARKGAPRKIPKEDFIRQIVPLLEEPEQANELHWTIRKLHGYIRGSLAQEVSYPSLLRYVHEQGYVTKIPRPMPEPRDQDKWEEDRERFAHNMGEWLSEPSVELWFADESGIEGDPRPRKRWVVKGSKPTIPYAGSHLRRNLVGAVRPSDGALSCLIVPYCDTNVFQLFLDNMAAEQPPREGVRSLLIMDNASWHKSKSLNWHHFEPVYLPAYSPDFNPIERLWLLVKSKFFADFYTRKGQELEERIIHAIKALIKEPQLVENQCRISGNL